MIAPAKVTNGQRLFDQLESLFSTSDPPGEFQVRLLRREAENLVRADAGEGYIVLAGVEALQWNREEAARLARNAVALDKCSETLMNAALTMRNVHRMDLANEFMRLELSKNPPDAFAFPRAVTFLLSSGDIDEAVTVMKRASELGVSLEETPNAVLMKDVLQAVGVSTEQVKLEFEAVRDTLFSLRKRQHEFSVRFDSDPDGGRSVVARFEVYGTFEDEIALEEQLASRLIELENWDPVRFSIELACVTPYADQAKRAA